MYVAAPEYFITFSSSVSFVIDSCPPVKFMAYFKAFDAATAKSYFDLGHERAKRES